MPCATGRPRDLRVAVPRMGDDTRRARHDHCSHANSDIDRLRCHRRADSRRRRLHLDRPGCGRRGQERRGTGRAGRCRAHTSSLVDAMCGGSPAAIRMRKRACAIGLRPPRRTDHRTRDSPATRIRPDAPDRYLVHRGGWTGWFRNRLGRRRRTVPRRAESAVRRDHLRPAWSRAKRPRPLLPEFGCPERILAQYRHPADRRPATTRHRERQSTIGSRLRGRERRTDLPPDNRRRCPGSRSASTRGR